MKIIDELLPGCILMEPNIIKDDRGTFIKTYQQDDFKKIGINFLIKEEFFSVSHKNVVRGMHFQLPPKSQDKLVYCVQGKVLDVLLDLRGGDGFGRVASAIISSENAHLIFIPKGIAHGFLALEDYSCMVYKTSTVHFPNCDHGISWNSFGFDWKVSDPIISIRDQKHAPLGEFISPFKLF